MSKQIPWQKIRQDIETKFSKYVLAVSGGVDSMFLLDFVRKSNANFVVAHYNHNCSQPQNDSHADFVQQYCKNHNIPCVIGKRPGNTTPATEGALRNARYDFLTKVMADHNAERIMTGHHMNDQMETVLLRLIAHANSFDRLVMVPDNGLVYRPLLRVPKEYIETYCTKHGIPHVVDSSNASSDCLRNWFRNDVIPLLEERCNPLMIARRANEMVHD